MKWKLLLASLLLAVPAVAQKSIPGQSGARLTSWIDAFIYVDGAFRFFGTHSRPFWMPAPAAKR